MNLLFRAAATALLLSPLAACAPDVETPPIGDSDAPITAMDIVGMDGVERHFEVLDRQIDSDGWLVEFEVDERPLVVRVGDGDPRYVEVFAIDGDVLLSIEQPTDGPTRAVDGRGQQLSGADGIPRCWLTDSVDDHVIAALEAPALAFLGDDSGAGRAGLREARAAAFRPNLVLGCPGAECEAEGSNGGAKCCCKVGQSCNYGVSFNGTGWCACEDGAK